MASIKLAGLESIQVNPMAVAFKSSTSLASPIQSRDEKRRDKHMRLHFFCMLA